jgi:hypothetical protein
MDSYVPRRLRQFVSQGSSETVQVGDRSYTTRSRSSKVSSSSDYCANVDIRCVYFLLLFVAMLVNVTNSVAFPGLDAMMPEPRSNPRWFPRPGANVTITFGEAVNKAMDPLLDRLSVFAAEGGQETDVESAAEGALGDLKRLYPNYPSPSANLFPPITPLMEPPDGVAWPVSLAHTRSAATIERHGESARAKMARSLIAAELRAHLMKLGESQGRDLTLAHRPLEGEKIL